MGSMLGLIRVIAKDVKSCIYCCYVRCAIFKELGLPDKGLVIKWLVICNNWELEPLDLLNGLALGFYRIINYLTLEVNTLRYVYGLNLIIEKLRY